MKTPVLESLINKVTGLKVPFLKRRLQHKCFPVKFTKFFRTSFFTEHFWGLLLKIESLQNFKSESRWNKNAAVKKWKKLHWQFSKTIKIDLDNRFRLTTKRLKPSPKEEINLKIDRWKGYYWCLYAWEEWGWSSNVHFFVMFKNMKKHRHW